MLKLPPRPGTTTIAGLEDGFDELFKEAVEVVCQYEKANTPLLQRRLSVGYARAARIMDQLLEAGVVGPQDGVKPREVLIHNSEEVLGKAGSSDPQEAVTDDPFYVPAGYDNPPEITLTQVENPAWEPQLAEITESDKYKSSKASYPLLLGRDEKGELRIESLLDAGNLIIAGNSLSRKENLVDTILVSQLLRHSPHELRLLLIDPTHYLDLYNGVPHLLDPVVNDFGRMTGIYRWCLMEMNRRQKRFAEAGVRNINSYNALKGVDTLPRILIVNFISWFVVETEDALTALSATGPNTGIYNIIVVDKASGKGVPNGIKNNIPARVVFRMTSAAESRAIGITGADGLEAGEIIYKPNFGGQVRLKAVFTPEENVKEVTQAIIQSVRGVGES